MRASGCGNELWGECVDAGGVSTALDRGLGRRRGGLRRGLASLLVTLSLGGLACGCASTLAPEATVDDLAPGGEDRALRPQTPDLSSLPSWLQGYADELVQSDVFQLAKFDDRDPKSEPEAVFYFLPDETPGSVSLGDTSNGAMVHAMQLEAEGPTWTVLPRQRARDLRYGTDELIALLVDAANRVATQYPGARMLLGNVGRAHGGDIPYSVSHNSGRDADIAFYALNPEGEPVEMPDLLSFNDRGFSNEYRGYYRFDVVRNWALVRALVESDAADLQFLFISNGLRALLLNQARAERAPEEVIAKASALLWQPGPQIPHNDHLHVRIYCSDEDIQAGCVDRGVVHSWAPARSVTPSDGVNRALRFLGDERAEGRIAAIRRLELLGETDAVAAVLPLLQDGNAEVRATALEVASTLEPEQGLPYLLAQLDAETDPALLIRELELVARVGGDTAAEALASFVRVEGRDPRAMLTVDGPKEALVLHQALDIAQGVESFAIIPALVDALRDGDVVVRAKAAEALALLTNHRPTTTEALVLGDDGSVEAARALWSAQMLAFHDADRARADVWLQGFEAAGYELPVSPREMAQTLASACGDERPWLRVNAQRLLMEMTGNRPESLTWPPEDAQEYWTRWTARNRSRIAALR